MEVVHLSFQFPEVRGFAGHSQTSNFGIQLSGKYLGHADGFEARTSEIVSGR